MRTIARVRRSVLNLLLLGLVPVTAATARTTAGPGADVTDAPDEPELIVRDFSFDEDLKHGGDVSLVGIWTAREITFGLPDYWEVDGDPIIHLDVIRSEQLIPEVSSVTVWADGRPVGTYMLDGVPGEVDEIEMTLPLASDSGYHTITFVAYHRSLLPCELSDHPGLWSRVLGTSYIRVRYRPAEPELSLSRWPYPFRDDRDPDPAPVVLVVPRNPTREEIQTAGYVASFLGHAASWRPMDLHIHKGSVEEAPPGHVVAIVRGDGNSALQQDVQAILGASTVPEVSAAGHALRSGKLPPAGLLALAPRPGTPTRVLLAVTGRDRAGLLQLATLLAGEESSRLPVGQVELVDGVRAAAPAEPRRWKDAIPPEESFTLADLGLDDRMAAGYRGGTVAIPMPLVPDAHPTPGAARLELVYSYSAQASPQRSRLDVLVDDAAAGGTALTDVNGRNRETMLLDLPVHEMGPDSNIYVRFSLTGLEEPICLGETHDELWGTVHSDSKFTLPRDYWARIPDLALLRFGGYPFGIRPDLSETLFVLPERPTRSDLQLFVWLAAELGRVARGDRFAYSVRLGGLENAEELESWELVVVDSGSEAKVLTELGLLEMMSFTVNKPVGVGLALASGGELALGADTEVSYIEAVRLPWDRTALVAYAVDPRLFERVGPCLEGAPLFDRLRGRVTRIASCTDLAVIPAEDLKAIGEQPARTSAYAPVRKYYWPLLIGLLLAGAVAVLVVRWLKERRAERAAAEEDGVADEV